MTPAEQMAVDTLIYAVRRVEWSASHGKCPACARSRAYGVHVCSCPVGLALKKATAAKFAIPPRPSDTPLIDPPKGDVSLKEIGLEDWLRWRWTEVTAGGDKARRFTRGKERTPDEVAEVLQKLDIIRELAPGLFPEEGAHP